MLASRCQTFDHHVTNPHGRPVDQQAKAIGRQVVGLDGSQAGTRRGVIRTLAFPLSFILLGLGFIGILFQRDRRALHDLIAGTAVIYAWDVREARLRSLAREGSDRRA